MKVLVFKDIKNKRWTIWDETRSVHLGYKDSLVLKNCKLIVLEEKRKQVVKSKKRFPHAFIVGDISSLSGIDLKKIITYNPFKNSHFQKNGKNIKSSKMVKFSDDGKCYSR